MSRLGVCFVGAGGAVATTVIAGVALMKRGLAPRIGMVTETEVWRDARLAPLDGLVFGGWDLRDDEHLRGRAPRAASSPSTCSTRSSRSFARSSRGRAWSRRSSSAALTRKQRGHRQAPPRGAGDPHPERQGRSRRRNKLDRRGDGQPRLDRALHRGRRRPPHGRRLRGRPRRATTTRISPAMKYLYLACKLGHAARATSRPA